MRSLTLSGSLNLFCLVLVSICIGLPAQGEQPKEERQQLPQGATAETVAAEKKNGVVDQYPLPEPRLITGGSYVEPTDDEPDFAPMQERLGDDDDAGKPQIVKGNPYVLSFANGDYEPEPGIDPELLQNMAADPGGYTYGYIMIRGRMAKAKMLTLRQMDIQLFGWHTYQSVTAKIPYSAVPGLQRLPFVHWVGYARPPQKLADSLARALDAAAADQEFDIHVSFFESDLCKASETIRIGEDGVVDEVSDQGAIEHVIPNGPFHKALTKLGFQMTFYNDNIQAMRGNASKAEILKIRDLNFVQFVELDFLHKAHHDQAMSMISQDRVRNAYPGTGVNLGWIDSGIHDSPYHADLTSKYYRAWDTTGQGAYDDKSGHGTHVAGTIFGRGAADKRYIGCAPNVGSTAQGSANRIYVGRYIKDDGWSSGNVNDLYVRFRDPQTIDKITTPKRSLVNCSWGSSPTTSSGWYGSEAHARDIDNIVHDNKQTYVFASGNTDSNPGVSTSNPGVAKNVLTVGALIDRFGSTLRPGTRATFSRYGTRDGRAKPEVCAPGDLHTSCLYDTADKYTNKEGTSMAAPTVTGALASLIDRNSFWDYNAVACKATAVAAAKAMTSSGTVNLYRETDTGWGVINSHKMNYGSSGSNFHCFSGQLDEGILPGSGNTLDTFDLAIPSNVTDVKVVLTWTESAALPGATQARKYGLRCYADVSPYTSGATGEHSMSSTVNNTISTTAWTATIKGKTVRFKVHAYSIGLLQKIQWSVCVFWYYKSPYITSGSAPTISMSTNRTAVRPGESVELTATMATLSTMDEFNHARVYFSSPTSWAMTRIDRTGADGVLQTYTDTSHTSAPYPLVTSGWYGGMTIGQGFDRSIKFYLTAPSSVGSHTLYTRAFYHGSTLSQLSDPNVVCVDNQAPSAIAKLDSTSHTVSQWSNSTSLKLSWGKALDVGCAGIKRLHYVTSTSKPGIPSTVSPSLSAAATSHILTVGDTSTGYHFSIRALDNVDYLGPTVSIGPFKIDTTLPVITKLVINNGASKTGSLQVSVATQASDTYSGVQSIQYSATGTSWTPLSTYSSSPVTVDLSTIPGGTTSEGTKQLYVRVRDLAGNYSAAAKTSIVYLKPPVLTGITNPQLEAVNHDYFRVTGTGFTETTRVKFGTSNILTGWTSAHEDWWPTGSFRVISDTVLYVYPPQGKTPGNHSLQSYNGVSYSNALGATIVANTGHILRTSTSLTAGNNQTIMVTKAGLKSTVVRQVIVASLFNSPSVLLPIYKLDIGNNFSHMVMFPQWGFDANGVSTITFPTLATFKGLTAYLQAAYLDFTAPSWPMPVSTGVWSTTYN